MLEAATIPEIWSGNVIFLTREHQVSVVTMLHVLNSINLIVPGLDTDKNPIESTPVISPEGKVEAVNEEMPTENGNNNITDTEKVS